MSVCKPCRHEKQGLLPTRSCRIIWVALRNRKFNGGKCASLPQSVVNVRVSVCNAQPPTCNNWERKFPWQYCERNSRDLLEKPTDAQLIVRFSAFYAPPGSLPVKRACQSSHWERRTESTCKDSILWWVRNKKLQTCTQQLCHESPLSCLLVMT
jgi:hypothetical protein